MAIRQNSKKGFSLIALAGILAVIAILAITLIPNDSDKRSSEVKSTNSKISTILKSIKVLQAQDPNYTFPCPAAFNKPTTDSAFGVSIGGPSTPSTASVVANSNCTCTAGANFCLSSSTIIIGAVPTKTLGLSDDYAFDEWGNRISYVMTAPVGATLNVNSLNNTAIPGLQALLISHGPNGMGAYNRKGTLNSTCAPGSMSATLSEYANCKFDTTANFVKDNWNTTVADNYFDDVVGGIYGCPGNVPDCNLWLDAADGATVVADSNVPPKVSMWKDKSGNANNATASGSACPVYETSALDVSFNGTNNVMKLPNLMRNAVAGTTLFVTKHHNPINSPEDGSLLADWGMSGATDHWPWYQSGTSYDAYQGWGSSVRYGPMSLVTDPKQLHLGEMISAKNDWRLYINGAVTIDRGTTPHSSNTVAWNSAPLIGSKTDGTYRYNGTASEIVTYPRALGDADRKKVECYLANKWNITGAKGGCRCPAGVLGCNLWLDGSDNSTVLNGGTAAGDTGPVTTWKDNSGYGNNATAGGGASPTYRTGGSGNGINSLGVLRFNGSSNVLSLPNLMAGRTSGTVIFVTKKVQNSPSTQSNAGPVLGRWGAPAQYDDHWPWTSGDFYLSWGSNARSSFASAGVSGKPDVPFTSAHIGTMISAPGDWRQYVNGVNYYTTNTNTVSWGTTPNIGLNDQGTSGSSFWLYGDVAEIITYPNALSNNDRVKIECYLKAKWATSYSGTCP